MTRYARPTGRCHWQRCLTAFDSNLLQVLILYELISSVGTKKSTYKVLFYKIWWVVQDDSLRSPFGSLPLATLSHCVRLEPAAGSHPVRVNIECWDEKKAPIRYFFKIWWVVQDDSLRSPFGSLPLATLSHYVRLEPAAGSHPLRVNIECWDEKKAPIRCFFKIWWVVQDSNLRPID